MRRIFSGFGLWWLCCTWAQAAPTVLVLGDSLSAAYGLRQEQGWVSLLTQRLRARGLPHRVINASVSGETSAGGAGRIGRALQTHQPDVVIVELGGNDGLRGLPPSLLENNLKRILKAVDDADARALLVGVELPPNYGKNYTTKFRAAFARAADAGDVALVPSLFARFPSTRGYFQADGIHPTAAAQVLILDSLWPVLQPLLKN